MTDTIATNEAPVLAINKWATNGHLIADCARLGYLRDTDLILDPTYGYGTFWKVWKPSSLVACDLDEAKSPIGHSVDFTALPFAHLGFDAVVFDPPYKLTGTPQDTGGMDERFGVDQPSVRWQDRMALIRAGAAECARVCERTLLVKCQDQVVSSKIRWQTLAVIETLAPLGFGLRDRFDFLSYRAQPAERAQKNAHRGSSQMLVFERGWSWSDIEEGE